MQLALGLTSLGLGGLCLLHSLGVLPDSTVISLKGRKALCEAMAIACSSAAVRNDRATIESTTRAIVARNPEIQSAAVRLASGEVIFAIGPHPSNWKSEQGEGSTTSHVQVPIKLNDQRWGTVEVRFAAPSVLQEIFLLKNPTYRFIALFTGINFLFISAYLHAVSRQLLRTSGGIPQRVREALDTLVEGVLLIDSEQRIAFANEAFARKVGRSAQELENQTARELGWASQSGHEIAAPPPWMHALTEGEDKRGTIIGLRTEIDGLRTLSVNSTPIRGDDGTCWGVLATFDDLTAIEKKNSVIRKKHSQLRQTYGKLKQTQAKIRRQNQQLRDLATLDPLTSCLNRRAFFERFEPLWQAAQRYGQPLSCIMLDIDHFKSINDRFGHAVGDQALQMVSGVLRSMVRASDLICRYGGEEFCVLLPVTTAEEGAQAAERFRKEIESRKFAGISVTASFGVSSVGMKPKDPHDLLNLADKALYASKHTGRNKVTRFDQMPTDLPVVEPKTSRGDDRGAVAVSREVSIPYHAVTSLVAALAHRDPSTAEHSRRVADLCVMAGKGLLSERECYVLEIAGLLHDVGKLGIPDAILHKPGPLTENEWKIMEAHDRMGVDIVSAAFSSKSLCEVVGLHHAWFGGNPRWPDLPTGEAIPLGARLLSIADTYDAIVSDRVYRRGRSQEQAFAELRRCSGSQFDPALVEHFIETMKTREGHREPATFSLSKQGALQIGLLIEQLADALDSRDLAMLKGIAMKLETTASREGVETMAEVAQQLSMTIEAKPDWLNLVELSNTLLELCRSTQATYLTSHRHDHDSTEEPRSDPDLAMVSREPAFAGSLA
jgi:diguanylate cyclase (GGDEF)-like protein/PAS domain S-box-containing protein